ncbi:MAG TPA: hypothetical protein VFU36_09580, partial [Jatrophihabitans sp.]|nr:hypothetical protein [Jatrophihabitans sp.]
RLAGLIGEPAVRCQAGGGGHRLLGRPMPAWQLGFPDDSRASVAEMQRPGRGLLVSTDRSRLVNRLAAGWVDRVDIVTGRWLAGDRTAGATGRAPVGADPSDSVLVRPDGYVAWAGSDTTALAESLRRWFGPPQPAVRPSRPYPAVGDGRRSKEEPDDPERNGFASDGCAPARRAGAGAAHQDRAGGGPALDGSAPVGGRGRC